MENYRGFLEVSTGDGEGYYSFLLTDDVYRYAQNDLDDLRLVNQEGKVIAYYIVDGSRMESLHEEAESAFQYTFSKDGWAYYDIELSHFGQEPYYDDAVNLIILQSEGKDFASEVKVLGSYDKEEFTPLLTDVIYRVDAGEKLELNLPKEENYSVYRIGVKGSQEVLKLINATTLKTNYIQEAALKKKVSLPFDIEVEDGYTLLKVRNENRLQFDTLELLPQEMKSGQLFDRYVTIQTGNKESGYTILGEGRLTYVDLKSIKVSLSTMQLQYVFQEPYFEVKIENKDNAPLTFEKDSLSVEVIQHKVVFEGEKQENYKLYYGNEQLSSPMYDIGQFKESIEEEHQYEAVVGQSSVQEQSTIDIPAKQSIWENKWLMNGAIAIIAILLLWIIVKNFRMQQ